LAEKIKESPIQNKKEVLLNLCDVLCKTNNKLLKKYREDEQDQIKSNKCKQSSKCQNWQESENKS